MRRRERLQVLLAVLGATATILAGVIPSTLQLIDEDAGAGKREQDRWVSCVAAVERVVDLLNVHPSVARLYAHEREYMPRLFNQTEQDACGSPRYLIEQMGGEIVAH